MAYQTNDGQWKGIVCDHSSSQRIVLCELRNNEWHDCIFSTQEEAEQAEQNYYKFWKGEQ